MAGLLDWLLRRIPVRHPPTLETEDDRLMGETDKDRLQRDVAQVDRFNRYLLDKAVARGYIKPEVADAIRLVKPVGDEDIDPGEEGPSGGH